METLAGVATSATQSTTTTQSNLPISQRQIRAVYDSETITVYQAYKESIATSAVQSQKLNASSDFMFNRMTWIKPSWNWMMYRSGYSYKDERQTHILALKMWQSEFLVLLRKCQVNEHIPPNEAVTGGKRAAGPSGKRGVEGGTVVVQWDPERSNRGGKLQYRSIQIGISRKDVEEWLEKGILSIEDVTDRAREHKRLVDEGKTNEQIAASGVLPVERVYELPEDVRAILGMD